MSASSNHVAHADADAKNRPIRHAAIMWAKHQGYGHSMHYSARDEHWHIDIQARGYELQVRVNVEGQAVLLGQVGHVQGNDARQAQPLDREHQAQVAPEVIGVDHADDEVGPLLALGAAGQHVAGDALVR
mgnify:CR=1 FL=1